MNGSLNLVGPATVSLAVGHQAYPVYHLVDSGGSFYYGQSGQYGAIYWGTENIPTDGSGPAELVGATLDSHGSGLDTSVFSVGTYYIEGSFEGAVFITTVNVHA